MEQDEAAVGVADRAAGPAGVGALRLRASRPLLVREREREREKEREKASERERERERARKRGREGESLCVCVKESAQSVCTSRPLLVCARA